MRGEKTVVNKAKILISSISVMVLIAVVVLLLALRSCNRTESDAAGFTGHDLENATNTRVDDPEKPANAEMAGHYEIMAMISDGKESGAEDLALLKSKGLSCTIVLNADGTGLLNLFGEESSLTWDGEAIFTTGKTMPYICRFGLLTLINGNSALTFSRTQQP